MNKKAWLDYLYYKIGKQQYDFYVAGTYKKDGETQFTKWKKYSEAIFPIDFDGSCEDWKKQNFFEQINQRQILPFEIVLDIENPKQINKIVEKLKGWGWKPSLWKTGSRGYHIHILCHRKLKEKEKLAVIKKLGADIQKCSEKNLIALENCPHWKTGRLKTQITKAELKENADKILKDVEYKEEIPQRKEIVVDKPKYMKYEDYGN